MLCGQGNTYLRLYLTRPLVGGVQYSGHRPINITSWDMVMAIPRRDPVSCLPLYISLPGQVGPSR